MLLLYRNLRPTLGPTEPSSKISTQFNRVRFWLLNLKLDTGLLWIHNNTHWRVYNFKNLALEFFCNGFWVFYHSKCHSTKMSFALHCTLIWGQRHHVTMDNPELRFHLELGGESVCLLCENFHSFKESFCLKAEWKIKMPFLNRNNNSMCYQSLQCCNMLTRLSFNSDLIACMVFFLLIL